MTKNITKVKSLKELAEKNEKILLNKLSAYKKNSQKWKAICVLGAFPNKWFRPEDLMQYEMWKTFYIGYEANSRLSELAKAGILDNTEVLEDGKPSKKKMWKINSAYAKILDKAPAYKEAIKLAKLTIDINSVFKRRIHEFKPRFEKEE